MAERSDMPPLDLTTFKKVRAKQYDWQIADGGEIWGLVAGDQGYDQTGITIEQITGAALIAVSDEGRETRQWPLYAELQAALGSLFDVCLKIIESRKEHPND